MRLRACAASSAGMRLCACAAPSTSGQFEFRSWSQVSRPYASDRDWVGRARFSAPRDPTEWALCSRTRTRLESGVEDPPFGSGHCLGGAGGRGGAGRDEERALAALAGVEALFRPSHLPSGFPAGSEGKASARNAGDTGSNPGSAPLEEDMAAPLQYSCLENPMDGRAWWAIYIVHGVTESRTRLSDFTFFFHFLSPPLK